MKTKLFILALLFCQIAFGNCPVSVTYSSPNFTFNYSGSTPSGTYNQLRVTISSGTGSGNSYLLSISSNAGSQIVTDNASGQVDGSSVASQIEYYNSGSSTSVTPCNTSTPLPVKLIKFEVKKISDNKCVLNWVTASEINNEKFEVQKSYDGIEFSPINEVAGSGNSLTLKSYSLLDYYSPGTTTFYRLKQIDLNGEFEYSKIVSLRSVTESTLVYPNPFSSEINISPGEYEGENVELRTINGVVLYNSKTHSISTDNLPNGIYTLTVGESNFKVIKKE